MYVHSHVHVRVHSYVDSPMLHVSVYLFVDVRSQHSRLDEPKHAGPKPSDERANKDKPGRVSLTYVRFVLVHPVKIQDLVGGAVAITRNEF
jgi:hypothetical protein